jgi:hypothetical protein
MNANASCVPLSHRGTKHSPARCILGQLLIARSVSRLTLLTIAHRALWHLCRAWFATSAWRACWSSMSSSATWLDAAAAVHSKTSAPSGGRQDRTSTP